MQKIKNIIKKVLPEFVADWLRQAYAFWKFRSAKSAESSIGEPLGGVWRKRIDDVIACPDNEFIERVPGAGKLTESYMTMHNGVKVYALGYYGSGTLNMLLENKGVHEPQEERAFEAVIRSLPEKCTMLELGAYWGFYSLSLLHARPKGKCYLVEPRADNIVSGKMNFKLNGRKGIFERAFVGEKPEKKPKTISVDKFCESKGIEHLNILHSDIQGFELAMLKGSERMLSTGRIDYIFISTHSNELHYDCIDHLCSKGFEILAEADLDATYSWDGLIVAKRPGAEGTSDISISKR